MDFSLRVMQNLAMWSHFVPKIDEAKKKLGDNSAPDEVGLAVFSEWHFCYGIYGISEMMQFMRFDHTTAVAHDMNLFEQ